MYIWDVTVTDTFGATYLSSAITTTDSITEGTAFRKDHIFGNRTVLCFHPIGHRDP